MQVLKHITVCACDGMHSLIRDPMTGNGRPTHDLFHSSGVFFERCLYHFHIIAKTKRKDTSLCMPGGCNALG